MITLKPITSPVNIKMAHHYDEKYPTPTILSTMVQLNQKRTVEKATSIPVMKRKPLAVHPPLACPAQKEAEKLLGPGITELTHRVDMLTSQSEVSFVIRRLKRRFEDTLKEAEAMLKTPEKQLAADNTALRSVVMACRFQLLHLKQITVKTWPASRFESLRDDSVILNDVTTSVSKASIARRQKKAA
jgi:hypothetical protein